MARNEGDVHLPLNQKQPSATKRPATAPVPVLDERKGAIHHDHPGVHVADSFSIEAYSSRLAVWVRVDGKTVRSAK